ncbi:MAG: prepilin peptidase [Phycisphaeraceae bacterium]|nr:prepilin peptidase [Phycisphaeraceae bacterium]
MTPIQSDLAMWFTLRTRRQREEPRKGLDAMASRWIARIKHGKMNLPYLKQEAEATDLLGPAWKDLTDAQLDEKVIEVRSVLARRKYEPVHVREAFAAVREVARRQTGEYPYIVQLMGAMGLFHGQIVEMVTGEGKTLTATLAACTLGWLRRPVHVITVNDYLAERDADGRMPIYRRCGLVAGAITGETQEPDRRRIYRQPITYLTQKELVADWLRDQLKLGRITDPVTARWMLQGRRGAGAEAVLIPGVFVAIVDELDAVLIDEAVTPLIIAQARGEDSNAPLYKRAREMALKLKPDRDFVVEPRKRRVKLTDDGRDLVENMLHDDESVFWRSPRRRDELIEQALTAEHCYQLGVQYQLVEDKVVIVDEYTGRFMQDRQWQHGLHQAVEAKHDVEVTEDRETLASMSFQRYFKQYPHLCGMTGTAAEAIPELETTYNLPVRIIPTNRPIQRVKMPDLIFVRSVDRWAAVVSEIEQMRHAGRPVLVGTRSIEASEYLSGLLKEKGMEHQVLNAVHHKIEADIVKKAGQSGAITVATNMAGRGTDIKLGPGVREAGGLHVILTERHTAGRIDRQLYGRSGRQGDPGSARDIISLEDDLVTKFAPRTAAALRRLYAGRTGPLPVRLRFVFNRAQQRAQRQAFGSRSQVLRHDEELDRTLPR